VNEPGWGLEIAITEYIDWYNHGGLHNGIGPSHSSNRNLTL
jgi:hypothetical protein